MIKQSANTLLLLCSFLCISLPSNAQIRQEFNDPVVQEFQERAEEQRRIAYARDTWMKTVKLGVASQHLADQLEMWITFPNTGSVEQTEKAIFLAYQYGHEMATNGYALDHKALVFKNCLYDWDSVIYHVKKVLFVCLHYDFAKGYEPLKGRRLVDISEFGQ